jgi:hypothetical protein
MDKFGKTFKKSHRKAIPLLVVIGMKGISLHTDNDFQNGFENDLFKIIH